jgi:transposase-like protein
MPRRRRWRPQTVPVPDFKLEVPSTVPYPDDFYRRVADAYRFLALVSPRPAVELADANGVPPSTTRRWVKEARRRGVLAPGQKGRRGWWRRSRSGLETAG